MLWQQGIIILAQKRKIKGLSAKDYIPTKTVINGKTYAVRRNNKTLNSHGRTRQQDIEVGTASKHAASRFANYLHEVLELTCFEQNLDYESMNRGRLFIMNHGDLDVFAQSVATSLWPSVNHR